MSASSHPFAYPAPDALRTIERRALLVGAAGAALCVAGALLDWRQFLSSYLVGYMLWLGITVGSLALLMIYHLTGGQWGVVNRRIMESAGSLVWLMALFFLPIGLGVRVLYPWARPEVIAHDIHIQGIRSYLGVTPWALHAIIYFVCWWGLATYLNRSSERQDASDSATLRRSLQNASGAGLVILGLTMTFASIDWLMSLMPHWYSTIYAMIVVAGEGVGALSFCLLCLWLLMKYRPLAGILQPDHFLDVGKLLLAFLMVWAYVSFSQWLVIWSGNEPEEIAWYLNRSVHGWQWVAAALFALHFAMPFLLLLSRDFKRRAARLAMLAAWLLVMRVVDLVWLIRPNEDWQNHLVHFSWMDLVTPVAIGGIWLVFFLRKLLARPLLPLHDPELAHALAHEPFETFTGTL